MHMHATFLMPCSILLWPFVLPLQDARRGGSYYCAIYLYARDRTLQGEVGAQARGKSSNTLPTVTKPQVSS